MPASPGKAAIRAIVGSLVPDLPADTSVDMLEAGLVDSLRLLEMVEVLEQRLGLSFPDDVLRAEHFCSVDAIERTVAELAGDHV